MYYTAMFSDADATCAGTSAAKGKITVAASSGADLATCKASCTAAGPDDCMYFEMKPGTTCTLFAGTCTQAGGATGDRVYSKTQSCYWTTSDQ
jgi:hypothetical protein